MFIPWAIVATILEIVAALTIITLIGQTVSDKPYEAIDSLVSFFKTYIPSFSVLHTAIFVITIYTVKNTLKLAEIYWRTSSAANNSKDLSNRILNRYLQAPFGLLASKGSSVLYRDTTQISDQVVHNAIVSGITVISETIVMMGLIIVLAWSIPGIALLAAIVLTIVTVIIIAYSFSRHSEMGNRAHNAHRYIHQYLSELFSGLLEIRVSGSERRFLEKYLNKRSELAQVATFIGTLAYVPRLVMELAIVSGVTILVIMSFLEFLPAGELLPALGIFAYAAFRLLPSFHLIATNTNQLAVSTPSVNEAKLIFESIPQLSADSSPAVLVSDNWNLIELNNISYHYPGSDHDALSDVSFNIKRGEFVAIVGPTGSGKSTLAGILIGAMRPSSGGLTVDNVAISEQPHAWWPQLGYVPQEPVLLDDSIKENISSLYPDTEINDEHLNTSIKLSQLKQLIDQLPQGIDTMIGEKGSQLSGGERQRIAIARLLYGNRGFKVLDEATSALDMNTEQIIYKSFRKLQGLQTLVTVTHRISSIDSFDKIIIMNQGHIVDIGTYAELFSKHELFRELSNPDNSD